MSNIFFLASRSALKRDAFCDFMPDAAVFTPNEEWTSQVPFHQPIGRAQAAQCAMARIEASRTQLPAANAVIVAIENYMDRRAAGSYNDHCIVLLEYGNCRVLCDSPYWASVNKYGYLMAKPFTDQDTFGKRLAMEFSKTENMLISNDDWFKAVGNSFNRKQQITEAIKVAIADLAENVTFRGNLTVFKDFPKPGVDFIDIFSYMAKPSGMYALTTLLINQIRAHLADLNVHLYKDVFIVGLESRGMALGMAVASELQCPFVPARKPGKLPGHVVRQAFDTEYSKDAFEMQTAYAATLPKLAIVIDDVLATGGSAEAACTLVELLPGQHEVVMVAVLLDVPAIRHIWRKRLRNYRVGVCI